MCSRVHTVLLKAPSLVLNIHVRWFTTTKFQRIQRPLLDAMSTCIHVYIPHTDTPTYVKIIKLICYKFFNFFKENSLKMQIFIPATN